MENGKPLRSSSNAAKDLKNTYLKNQGRRNIKISDINDIEESTSNLSEEEIEMKEQEEELTEQEQNDESLEFTESEEIQLLLERIKTLEIEKNKLKDDFLRKTAEVENIRRRTNKEKQDLLEYGNEKLILEFLSLLDDIGNAIEVGKRATDYEALLTGLELIHNKAKKLFENAGVTEMDDPTGNEFDVDYHDAMMRMASGLPENHIVQQIQKGYMIKDKVLRHARVVTSTGELPEINEENE